MSIWGRKVSGRAVAAAALVMVVAAFAALLPAMSQAPAREITLVARGMAFYLEGELETPNPEIHVSAGERVRVVLRNQDRGMMHDFAVPALDRALDPLDWNETDALTFEAPQSPGVYEYICRPHQLMMRGRIVVSPPAY